MASCWRDCLGDVACLCYFGFRIVIWIASIIGMVFLLAGGSMHEAVFVGTDPNVHYNAFSPAFRFLAAANGVVFGLVTISEIIAASIDARKKTGLICSLFVLDLVMTALMISACSAAIWEVHHVTLCDKVPNFCDTVRISVGFSLTVTVASFILTIMSASLAVIQLTLSVPPATERLPGPGPVPVPASAPVLSKWVDFPL